MSETKHSTVGTVDGHEVRFVVEGPEAQVLESEDDRIGSDVLATRIRAAINDIKQEVEQ